MKGLLEYIKNKISVDKNRLISRIESIGKQINPSTKLNEISLIQAQVFIENQNHPFTYAYKNGKLTHETMRGSIPYLAIVSHSISRQELYTQQPNVLGAFQSCF